MSDSKDVIGKLLTLEKTLRCNLCNELFEEPVVIGSCGDTFCKKCASEFLGKECPTCKIPVDACDSFEDRQLKEILPLVQRLKILCTDHFSSVADEKDKTSDENEVVREVENNSDSIDEPTIENLEEVGIRREVENHPDVDNKQVTDDLLPKDDHDLKADNSHDPENLTKDCNPNISVVSETQLSTSDPKPSIETAAPHIRPSQTAKRAQCKIPSCGDDKCFSDVSHQENSELMTPNNRASKKRPMSSPCMKTPKRPFRFSSPFSNRRNLVKGPECYKLSAIFSPLNIEKRNIRGETLLQVAVIKGDIERAKELLAKNANPNVKDNAGWTPLHEASNHGYLEIAKLLIKHGAHIDSFGQDNITPLHDALMNKQIEIANYLVLKGADIYAKTSFDNTALDLCKSEANKKLLLKSFSMSAKLSTSLPSKGVTPKRKGQKRVLMYTALNHPQKELLHKCADMLEAEVVDDFSPEVTHVVTSVDGNGHSNRTLKILQGIITGKWIVNLQWIDICLEYKKHVDEEPFEIPGVKLLPNTFGPKLARKNNLKKLPSLFDGLSFFIYGTISSPLPPKDDICELIQLGGGKLLSREPRPETVKLENHAVAHHAANGPVSDISHFVLYEDKPPRNVHVCADHICTVNVRWIIDCICSFQLIDPEKFMQLLKRTS